MQHTPSFKSMSNPSNMKQIMDKLVQLLNEISLQNGTGNVVSGV